MYSVWMLLKCPRFYYSEQCTCTHVLYFSLSEILLCTAQWTVWDSYQSVAVKHENENSTAAQPPIVIKRHTQVQNCGCDKHVKQATSVLPSGQRVERLKAKGRKFQHQPVDSGVQHGIIPRPPLPVLALLAYPRKKNTLLSGKLVDISEEPTY